MIHVGYTDRHERVSLDRDDLRTHVHGVGHSQVGKSRLIEYIARELIHLRKGFCLLDPHGNLYRDFLAWLSYVDPHARIIPFDVSETAVGYNPFRSDAKTPREIRTKADQMVRATLTAWGSRRDDDFPRLREWLTHIYYLLIEQQLPVSMMRHFIRYRSDEREPILARTQNDDARYWLEEKYAMPRREFTNYVESVQHRFAMFTHEQVEGIMSGEGIDIPQIVSKRQVLLCNLQQSGVISAEAARVIGTFLINDFVSYFAAQPKVQEFYLIVDECQRYLTPDIEESIVESAKRGLHLFLFHHHEGEGGTSAAMFQSAQVKIRFQGLRRFTLERPGKLSTEVISPESKPAPHTRLERYVRRLQRRVQSMKPPQRHSESRQQDETFPPMPSLPPLEYDLAPESLLRAFRYLTAEQLEALTGRSNQVVRRAMLSVKCDVRKLDGRNVYCYAEKGKRHENLAHELGITDVHIRLYQAEVLARWEQSGLREYENPDAFFQTTDGQSFFLEYQQTNPKEPPVEKAKRYDRMATEKRHIALCHNFRVVFTGPAAPIRQDTFAALPNPCRYWITDGLKAKCAYHSHTIGVPTQPGVSA